MYLYLQLICCICVYFGFPRMGGLSAKMWKTRQGFVMGGKFMIWCNKSFSLGEKKSWRNILHFLSFILWHFYIFNLFIALLHFYLPAFLTFSTSWRPRCTGLSFLHVSRRRAQMGGNIIIIIIINNIALHHHHHHHILILMCDCDMLHIKRSTAAYLCLVRWCILWCLAPKILSWKLYFNLWEDNSIVLMEVLSRPKAIRSIINQSLHFI